MQAVGLRAIRTGRLHLLPLAVEHAAEMAEVLSDPKLHTFIGGAPHTPPALRSRYERLVAGSPEPSETWCNWVIQLRDEGRLVGTVQATIATGRRAAAAEIAWVVGTPWQRRGIATEATRGLIACLQRHGVQAIFAHIHPDHRASAAVAAAAGLAPTAHRQEEEVRWELPPTPLPAGSAAPA